MKTYSHSKNSHTFEFYNVFFDIKQRFDEVSPILMKYEVEKKVQPCFVDYHMPYTPNIYCFEHQYFECIDYHLLIAIKNIKKQG